MRTRLRIKGKTLWKLCVLVLLGIAFSFCHTKIINVTMPATATVGQTIDMKLDMEISTNADGSATYMCAVLLPKGWAGSKNLSATYTSGKGNGNMTFTPTSTIATGSNGLTWPVYLKNKFGLAGNLIDDMEWVVMQTDKNVSWANGDKITGTINFKLKVGADDNQTQAKLAFVVFESADGLKEDSGTADDGYGVTAQYYNEFITSCFSVTGGNGDFIDFCNPQLTTIDPPKSLDNDFITITYNNNVTTTPLANASTVYLCATATTSDGKTITVCEQTDKTKLTQTTANSGLYKLTIWPRKFFGVTDAQTITSMTYYIKNQAGTVQVGYGGSTVTPFSYKFKCT